MDLRPVGYVIGLLTAMLGACMTLPMLIDIAAGTPHWRVFMQCAVFTILIGALTALSCRNGVGDRLTIQQTFLITTGVWLALPVFGALPFVLGVTRLAYVDGLFEAMSGLTTTGATVLSDLENLPKGLLLWRGILQWLGGIGIIVVAMVFLPELRVGGMQIFRTESFDTMGKILPRATEIASRISSIYIVLTLICAFVYVICGMNLFDAMVHAMTTIATGGFSNYDASFAEFSAAAQYAGALFMLLSSLPFVRFVQLSAGTAEPLLQDRQVRAFFITVGVIVAMITLWVWLERGMPAHDGFRLALFNTVSLLTGTGYASANYGTWGGFAVTVLFFTGLIGGCAGSTTCSIKIFRYQILFASIRAQLRAIHTPHGIFRPRYEGRAVSEDVLNSVMSFFVFFIASLGLVTIVLGMTGLDFVTSLSGATAALANIGPGFGEMIGPAGNYADLNTSAKWILAFTMLLGRLELMAIYAILTVNFWRA